MISSVCLSVAFHNLPWVTRTQSIGPTARISFLHMAKIKRSSYRVEGQRGLRSETKHCVNSTVTVADGFLQFGEDVSKTVASVHKSGSSLVANSWGSLRDVKLIGSATPKFRTPPTKWDEQSDDERLVTLRRLENRLEGKSGPVIFFQTLSFVDKSSINWKSLSTLSQCAILRHARNLHLQLSPHQALHALTLMGSIGMTADDVGYDLLELLVMRTTSIRQATESNDNRSSMTAFVRLLNALADLSTVWSKMSPAMVREICEFLSDVSRSYNLKNIASVVWSLGSMDLNVFTGDLPTEVSENLLMSISRVLPEATPSSFTNLVWYIQRNHISNGFI